MSDLVSGLRQQEAELQSAVRESSARNERQM